MLEPTPDQILEWKSKYVEIFSADSPRALYVFRSMTLGEQAQLQSLAITSTFFDAEEFIVSCGVLFPDQNEIDKAPANFISSLAFEIREVSGLGNAKTAKSLLQRARDESNLVINVAKTYVLATMPAYKEEDLEGLTFAQLCHKVAIAERIIDLNQQVIAGNQVTMDIIDPEEVAAAEKAEAEKRKKQAERFAKQGGHYDPDSDGPIKPKLDPRDPIAAKLRNS